ncbi:MAG: PqqD family protein [Clostridia bacterium]|nr:PqqD family protein [Clostridia bacterium]
MKLKKGFILRKVGGQVVVLPIAGDLDMNTMIKLNDTGAFLWEHMQAETDEDALVAALLAEYDVDEATARRSVQNFVRKLSDNGFLD